MNKDEQLDNDAKKRLEDANQVRSFTSADISVQTVRTRSCFLIVEIDLGIVKQWSSIAK